MVRLKFSGENRSEPMICYMRKRDKIDVNIVEGDIKNSKKGSVGFLVIEIPDISEEDLKEFKDNVEEEDVNVEVVKDG
uniref:NIL domain-containing protein n=1 Tax=Staphylococcus epidermidis TaxID=1282 RepID=UPI0028CB8EE0